MLAEVRHALAETLAQGMPEARVYDHPPAVIDWPESGLVVYVQPSDGEYLAPWLTFSRQGRGTVGYDVVVTIPMAAEHVSDAGPEWDALDAAVDPVSTSSSVFGALVGTEGQGVDLGLADFDAVASVAVSSSIQSARFVQDAGGVVTRYEISVPVQVIVQRS